MAEAARANLAWLARHAGHPLAAQCRLWGAQSAAAGDLFARTNCHITVLRALEDAGLDVDPVPIAGLPADRAAPFVLAYGGGETLGDEDHVLLVRDGFIHQSFFRRYEERCAPANWALLERAAAGDLGAQCALADAPLGATLDIYHYSVAPLTSGSIAMSHI